MIGHKAPGRFPHLPHHHPSTPTACRLPPCFCNTMVVSLSLAVVVALLPLGHPPHLTSLVLSPASACLLHHPTTTLHLSSQLLQVPQRIPHTLAAGHLIMTKVGGGRRWEGKGISLSSPAWSATLWSSLVQDIERSIFPRLGRECRSKSHQFITDIHFSLHTRFMFLSK